MATFGIGEGPRGGSRDIVARRERRRRSAVRDFLLTSLEGLDGFRYVPEKAQERPKDAPGMPRAKEWDESTARRECRMCGRVDALLVGLCRYCYSEELEAQS